MANDQALDQIYDRIDTLMWAGDIAELDRILAAEALVEDMDIVLAYLVATLPVMTSLQNRPAVYQHAAQLCVKAGEDPASLLKGLE